MAFSVSSKINGTRKNVGVAQAKSRAVTTFSRDARHGLEKFAPCGGRRGIDPMANDGHGKEKGNTTYAGAGGLKPGSRQRLPYIFRTIKACARHAQLFGRRGCQGSIRWWPDLEGVGAQYFNLNCVHGGDCSLCAASPKSVLSL